MFPSHFSWSLVCWCATIAVSSHCTTLLVSGKHFLSYPLSLEENKTPNWKKWDCETKHKIFNRQHMNAEKQQSIHYLRAPGKFELKVLWDFILPHSETSRSKHKEKKMLDMEVGEGEHCTPGGSSNSHSH